MKISANKSGESCAVWLESTVRIQFANDLIAVCKQFSKDHYTADRHLFKVALGMSTVPLQNDLPTPATNVGMKSLQGSNRVHADKRSFPVGCIRSTTPLQVTPLHREVVEESTDESASSKSALRFWDNYYCIGLFNYIKRAFASYHHRKLADGGQIQGNLGKREHWQYISGKDPPTATENATIRFTIH
jgi:hypothetical protein